MLEQLRYLVQFQILEDKRAKLIQSFEDTPRRIAELEREYEKLESVFLARKAEYDHAKKLHRAIEQEIAELETRQRRSRARMNEVKTNKEYQAILKEIEDLKREVSEKEDGTLELMETIEALGRELKAAEKDLQERRRIMEADKKKLQDESARLKERLDKIAEQQRCIREKMEPDLLKRSEMLIQRQAGIAVAPVENGVCQVCHLNIPPQKFIELQRDENILQCPHCRRFIYHPEKYAVCFSEDGMAEI